MPPRSDEKRRTSQALTSGDALSRLLKAGPKELADVFERTQREIARNRDEAEERRERLRKATQGPGKQFRL